MVELTIPITERQVRGLKVGDQVSMSGVVFTGRDAVHKYLHEGGEVPGGVRLEVGIISQCGPGVGEAHTRQLQGQPLGSHLGTPFLRLHLGSRWH